jgi:hypothetical protein
LHSFTTLQKFRISGFQEQGTVRAFLPDHNATMAMATIPQIQILKSLI